MVDTSALVALFLTESGHEEIADAIDDAPSAFISVASRIELTLVLCENDSGPIPPQLPGSSMR